ncbi:MAG: 4-(cytidine 5'-diphospho)-2-C-methyl-D-erythritol kinase [Propylenella sp.]
MLKSVERRAPAKVNLALHVVGRRADGYHLLDSIAVFADCADVIAVEPAEELSVAVSGPFASHAPADRSDLAYRAAEAFCTHVGRAPALRIRVEKNIPAGAGLGGGSADAAAVLSALDDFYAAGVPADELSAIGLRLGADVPMCLAGHALRARGVGEEILRIESWPPLPLVLVWPGRAVSTAAVFSALDDLRSGQGAESSPLRGGRWLQGNHREAVGEGMPLREPPAAKTVAALAAWLAGCCNDLEASALRLAPEIGDVLAALRTTPGCLLARMSGSGSACFGLFRETADAEAAAAQITAARRDWWVRATMAH